MRTCCEIKICGLTRRRDVELAVELGAAAVGFVLVPASPRFVPPERLAELVCHLPPGVKRVGVFADAPAAEIRRLVPELLDVAQLHGAEPAAFAAGLGVPVWKAFHLCRSADLVLPEGYPAERLLLDAASGGSGRTCDWSLAAAAAKRWRVMLAGGLCRENIRRAIETVHPFGVDLSSALEESPGMKSERKMREFFKEIAE